MDRTIRLLRICYWIGAVVDGFAVVQMLSPRVLATFYGLDSFQPGPDYRFAMSMGASLMAGWTALLVWADRRPLDRAAVLPLTVVPVIAGLAAGEIAAIRSGFLSPVRLVPTFAFQIGFAALCLVAYRSRRHFRRG